MLVALSSEDVLSSSELRQVHFHSSVFRKSLQPNLRKKRCVCVSADETDMSLPRSERLKI